jgi:DnaJ-class molecular chaperone
MDYRDRKHERTRQYFKYIYGWRLRTCIACNGSRYYDTDNSPPCGACDGTGKERYRGPKALPAQLLLEER